MGYVPKRTLYKLDFSQTEYAGLEVTTRSASMDVLLEVLELSDLFEQSGIKAIDKKQLDAVFGLFGQVLHSWNVETEDRQPVPATKDGLLSQDPEFVMAVVAAWAGEMTQAPPPLPGGPNSGATSKEAALQLASLSQSLPSSSAPKS